MRKIEDGSSLGLSISVKAEQSMFLEEGRLDGIRLGRIKVKRRGAVPEASFLAFLVVLLFLVLRWLFFGFFISQLCEACRC